MDRSIVIMLSVWVTALGACGDGGGGGSPGVKNPPNNPPGKVKTWYKPGVDTRWQIQLQGAINTEYNVELYDLDLFDTPSEVITLLHVAGRRVVCYFSAGTYEEWREDSTAFIPEVLGLPLEDFPDERWLDVRSPSIVPIMRARMDLAVKRGCDGVDPDNVDGYTNNTGFPLTASDQLAYNKTLAREAHARGLAVGLKNDLDQVRSLVAVYDFAVNEQCHEYDECEALKPFITAGKPVFNIEYAATFLQDLGFTALCQDSKQRNFRTLTLALDLDDTLRKSCDGL